MPTEFVRLNHEWNAEPNVPEDVFYQRGGDVALEFTLNRAFDDDQRGHLLFRSPGRWRWSSLNDHGWSLGQCTARGNASLERLSTRAALLALTSGQLIVLVHWPAIH